MMGTMIGILSVAALFFVRIGIPVLVLTGLGIIVDRWQTKREQQVKQYFHHS
jgi:hypothetical protein